MQDGQADPTLQTIQQEKSHESTETKEDETYSEQEEKPVQVPDVMSNIAPHQGRKRGNGKVEHLVKVLHQEKVWV